MRRRQRKHRAAVAILAAATSAILLAACGGSHAKPAASSASGVFTFAVWGDTPYSPSEAGALPRLVDQVNAAKVDLTVMVGDIIGGERCDNQVYTTARDTFNSFAAPLVYTPGDNEWTDCHSYGQDPIERLGYIRQSMFPAARSFGTRTLPLTQQRPGYPENARWRVGGVEFVTINVPGSNDNHIADPNADEQFTPRTPADRVAAEKEYQARDQADRDWLHQAFQEATSTKAGAVVIVMQADPGFATAPADRATSHVDGYDKLLAAFAAEATAFGKPVAIVHGDSHRLTLDKPLVDPATRQPVANVDRIESYGSPDVGWVKVTVDLSRADPFQSEPHLVESFRPS